jgi:dethiobiotin synthetase
MKRDGLFITGTDTGVGKTVVTAALAAGLRAAGRPVRALKPLATGSLPPSEDAVLLGQAAGHRPQSWLTLHTAASPARAAKEADEELFMHEIIDWIEEQEGEPLLVEGVGGWRVPIVGRSTIADLAVALGFPVLVVAANKLGVLNHTLLTVDAIRASGCRVAGVVLNDAFECHVDLARWNLEDLREQLDVPVVSLPQIAVPSRLAEAGAWLRQKLPFEPLN